MIPKPGGKQRRLGIATIADRVVQAALKLVLEPIFETGFFPCSYGFRPYRRAHDAVAEIRHFTSHSYEWVLEGDIKACFDEIDHTALMDRVRRRIGDKRVLALIKALLKAGILGEDAQLRDNDAGTPQGSILSPLLSIGKAADMVSCTVVRHDGRGAGVSLVQLGGQGGEFGRVYGVTRERISCCRRRMFVDHRHRRAGDDRLAARGGTSLDERAKE